MRATGRHQVEQLTEESTSREILELADWRRRVSTLYAEVRAQVATDPVAAWEHWRTSRETLFREHPQSPVPAERRRTFGALYYPYASSLRFEDVVVVPDEPIVPVSEAAPGLSLAGGLKLALPVSGGGTMAFDRLGWVEVPFPGGPKRLALYWMQGYAGGLFLPFRDRTNGTETYPAGRYLLDAAKSADLGGNLARGALVLDFNFAFQPSCAFDPKWACPLASPENRLDIAIEAGERIA